MRPCLFPCLAALLALISLGAKSSYADTTDARLSRIEAKQNEMDKKLDAILAGQQKSSDEHTQIRYWIKRG